MIHIKHVYLISTILFIIRYKLICYQSQPSPKIGLHSFIISYFYKNNFIFLLHAYISILHTLNLNFCIPTPHYYFWVHTCILYTYVSWTSNLCYTFFVCLILQNLRYNFKFIIQPSWTRKLRYTLSIILYGTSKNMNVKKSKNYSITIWKLLNRLLNCLQTPQTAKYTLHGS